MEVVDRSLYRVYRRYYNLGFFRGIEGLTGNPEVDLRKERVRKAFFLYYEKRSPEREKFLRQLAKALGVPEREVYDLRRKYRRNCNAIENPLLRSFFGNLTGATSKEEKERERALKKLKEVLKLIRKEVQNEKKG